jgi:hypothetical protein
MIYVIFMVSLGIVLVKDEETHTPPTTKRRLCEGKKMGGSLSFSAIHFR